MLCSLPNKSGKTWYLVNTYSRSRSFVYSFTYRSKGKGISGTRNSLGKGVVGQSLLEKPHGDGRITGHVGAKGRRLQGGRARL